VQLTAAVRSTPPRTQRRTAPPPNHTKGDRRPNRSHIAREPSMKGGPAGALRASGLTQALPRKRARHAECCQGVGQHARRSAKVGIRLEASRGRRPERDATDFCAPTCAWRSRARKSSTWPAPRHPSRHPSASFAMPPPDHRPTHTPCPGSPDARAVATPGPAPGQMPRRRLSPRPAPPRRRAAGPGPGRVPAPRHRGRACEIRAGPGPGPERRRCRAGRRTRRRSRC
jgi:hypothetical protein